MNSLIRALLSPFVDALIGAIAALLVFEILFNIENPEITKVVMLIGAVIGAAPWILKFIVSLLKNFYSLYQLILKLKVKSSFDRKKVNAIERKEQTIEEGRNTAQAERRALLLAEHEARRPICQHCGEKTEPVMKHRRTNGHADMRYRNNPLLCNRCRKPYSGVRPWNLPMDQQEPEGK